MIRKLAYVFGALLLLLLALYTWGSLLPVANSASKSIVINAPPQKVWDIMLDPSRVPQWQDMVAQAERIGEHHTRLTYTDGLVATMEDTLFEPPHRYAERSLPSPDTPFRSQVRVDIAPLGHQQSRFTVHSTIEIDAPLIRLAMRYIFTLDSAHASMLTKLKTLAEKP